MLNPLASTGPSCIGSQPAQAKDGVEWGGLTRWPTYKIKYFYFFSSHIIRHVVSIILYFIFFIIMYNHCI